MTSHCFFIGTTLGDNPVADHFTSLARELIRRGHRVVLLTPHRQSGLENHSGSPAIYTWPSERPTGWRDARFLRSLIEQYRPACFTANFAAVNVMTVTGRWARIPARVAWYHTVTGQLRQDQAGSTWKSRLLQLRKLAVYRMATHIVANSQASAEDLQRVYSVPREKCRVFHNSLADPYARGDLKTEPPTPGRLVCVGRFYPSKGQDVLIRALPFLREKVPGLHVEFIGQGPSLEACQGLAFQLGVQEKCTFTGQIEHGEVLRRMAGAVATVVPSRSEAFGLVNIESMAVGTPVVASKVGGIVEIVRDGLDGFLVEPDAPEALAARLGLLLCDRHLRFEMRANARQQFLAKFEQRRSVFEQANWHEAIARGESHPRGEEALCTPAPEASAQVLTVR